MKNSIDTDMIIDSKRGKEYDTANQPLYYSTAFLRPSLDDEEAHLYVRNSNPNREKLEEKLARLENGKYGFAFNSGMSAIAAALMTSSPGDHIIMPGDMYGGTYELGKTILKRYQLELTAIDQSDLNNIKNAITENTKAIYIETPSNPTLKVTDIKGIVEIARKNNLITIVDNTFMTPLGQSPLSLGADIVVHSATKFLGGHSDLLAGAVIVNDETIKNSIQELQVVMGMGLGTYDCWTLSQHLKTLSIRWKKSTENTEKLYTFFKTHEGITDIYYPGEDQLHLSQANHGGAVISFRIKDESKAQKFVDQLNIPLVSVSLGGVESILSHPKTSSHKALTEEERQAKGITEGLFRLSVGIEAADDLINDIKHALDSI
ncbi:trans-sulfuration enzyme family protein [Salinicoccus halodurans]|uniref:Homocysteine desulfhydrase n=1 Tax=Salinicoccus halodurans TaxID=407035 RepID=A0A0F7D3Q8_9STAP|nr:PLP-dependent aspartate aminotransferase family protein [Salinicoccus halodurans]AKG72910.1 cystathionine gamma-synthase [Salinicoccus halodurans]SFK75986.1 cystathionine beta-lyase [Salinicoccus halodurans]